MTAVANCFVLLYVGTEREEPVDQEDAKVDAKAAETI